MRRPGNKASYYPLIPLSASSLIYVSMHPMINPLEHVPDGVLQPLGLDLGGQSDIGHPLLCECVQGATLLCVLLRCSPRVAPLTQVIAGTTLGTVVATLAILNAQKWAVSTGSLLYSASRWHAPGVVCNYSLTTISAKHLSQR